MLGEKLRDRGERRFVFVMSNTGDEVLEGRAIEVRAHSLGDALDKVDAWQSKATCTLSLIGERRGLYSSQRFFPLVELREIPGHILRSERFGGFALTDQDSVDAERAQRDEQERRETEISAAFWGEVG